MISKIRRPIQALAVLALRDDRLCAGKSRHPGAASGVC
jgi:hypothetical protein